MAKKALAADRRPPDRRDFKSLVFGLAIVGLIVWQTMIATYNGKRAQDEVDTKARVIAVQAETARATAEVTRRITLTECLNTREALLTFAQQWGGRTSLYHAISAEHARRHEPLLATLWGRVESEAKETANADVIAASHLGCLNPHGASRLPSASKRRK